MKWKNDLEKREIAIWAEVQLMRCYFNPTLLLTVTQDCKDGQIFDVQVFFTGLEEYVPTPRYFGRIA